jgi:hypothetical protein
MVRKRCRNDEEPDKGNDDGENVKVKTSKKKGKDLVILLLMLLKKSFKMNRKSENRHRSQGVACRCHQVIFFK